MKPIIVSYYTKGTPYEEDADRLRKSARRFGYDSSIVGVNSVDSWEGNVNLKAGVVRRALDTHEEPILFLDADCWLKGPLPVFDDPKVPLVLDMPRQHRIHVGMFANAHKHRIWKHGCMWNSGVVYLRREEGVIKLLDKWQELCEQRPTVWDQFSLQDAWLAAGKPCAVGPFPEEYVAGRKIIGHQSGFHKYHSGGKRPRRKVLLLGSAPYITEWWAEHGSWFVNRGWLVVAMNNAWRVPGDDLGYWLAPNDFVGDVPNVTIPRNDTLKMWSRAGYGENCWNRCGNWLYKPSWMKRTKVQTTFVTSMHHLMNEALLDGCELEVAVAGSDLVYPKDGPTHFYGQGTPDPLRFSEHMLRDELDHLERQYTAFRSKIYNAGGQEETLLPFERLLMVD